MQLQVHGEPRPAAPGEPHACRRAAFALCSRRHRSQPAEPAIARPPAFPPAQKSSGASDFLLDSGNGTKTTAPAANTNATSTPTTPTRSGGATAQASALLMAVLLLAAAALL